MESNRTVLVANGSVPYSFPDSDNLWPGPAGGGPAGPGPAGPFANGSLFGPCSADQWDTSCLPYPIDVRRPPTWEVTLKIMFYVITIVVALVGNALVIFIVWKNKRMQTTTNYYIVNLAVSDVMVTVSCTWVHLVNDVTEGWVLGAFFCRFNSFAQVLSLVSSILTLTLISCDRFFGIIFAMKAHLTERRARSCLIVVWFCAIAVAVPLLFYRREVRRQWLNHLEVWCEDAWPLVVVRDDVTHVVSVRHPSRTFYYTFVCVVLFFIPILVMSLAYSMIIWRLWSKRYPGERIESGALAQNKVRRKVVVMLVVLLALFIICWLPLQASILFSEYRGSQHHQLPQWYTTFQYIATFMAYINSALNPIIYAGFNEKFKTGFLALFGIRRTPATRTSISWRRDSSFRNTTMVTRL